MDLLNSKLSQTNILTKRANRNESGRISEYPLFVTFQRHARNFSYETQRRV